MATPRSEARRRYSSSEVREKLAEVNGALAAGESVSGICDRLGITRQTYYRWRRDAESLSGAVAASTHRNGALNGGPYSGNAVLSKDAAMAAKSPAAIVEKLKELEAENQRLRDAIIELMLEKMALTGKKER